ncbi:DMT family transporter [Flammeovirga kamogawensis]|uniref:Multidrug efflux SMR transporter n=1 Tax=Flammeovirga kamogawensis TaxID=373891 RepID=A0ABX8GRU9_9BACT|nr:multidrug efflux SMR transporter [Flammeovirga kamogawensis]MBB6463164.1 small multidrug resistance pump [Flammeovirga kamogawensis]QWG05982.1 multidrug efflux SMR transporter [Flammeovirga kamogawensis]TRX67809.1 multidrug efflux SMR transporter [Flammeovirga kamogawensis]
MYWVYLLLAITSEIIATTALKNTDGFTKLTPSIITVVGYIISFFLLSLALKSIPMGIAYAIWSGIGIVAISIIGYLFHQQDLPFPVLIGIGFIIIGVIIINIFSNPS